MKRGSYERALVFVSNRCVNRHLLTFFLPFLEYRNKSMTKIFGGPYNGTYVLAVIIFSLGIFRDLMYVPPHVLEHVTHPLIPVISFAFSPLSPDVFARFLAQLRKGSPCSAGFPRTRCPVGEVRRCGVVRRWPGVGDYQYLGIGYYRYVCVLLLL